MIRIQIDQEEYQIRGGTVYAKDGLVDSVLTLHGSRVPVSAGYYPNDEERILDALLSVADVIVLARTPPVQALSGSGIVY
jgi:hypothetical protein